MPDYETAADTVNGLLEDDVSLVDSHHEKLEIDQDSDSNIYSSKPSKRPRIIRRRRDIIDAADYRRILATLDYHQHLNLSAHLYSSFLIKENPAKYLTVNGHKKFYHHWSSWPIPNAPAPLIIDDSLPESTPGPVALGKIRSIAGAAMDKYAQHSKNVTPSSILLDACETVMQRIVYQRIHSESRFPTQLEPVLEPEPRINNLWRASLIEIVDKYLRLPILHKTSRKYHPGSVSYRDLALEGPVLDRVNKLFGENRYRMEDALLKGMEKSENQSPPLGRGETGSTTSRSKTMDIENDNEDNCSDDNESDHVGNNESTNGVSYNES